MAYEIHIARLEDDLETVIPITTEEWIACARKIQHLRYVEEDFPDSIQTYSRETSEWIPVFWINDDGGFMRAAGFFNEVAYKKAIEIAHHLNAYIFGDENEVYYLPGFGVVYTELQPDNPELKIDTLLKYKAEYGDKYHKMIEVIARQKQEEKKRSPKALINEKAGMNKWTIVAIVLAALCAVYLMLTKFFG